jgi:5-methylcytosine-specific restriction endonuclease McrA
MTMPNEQVGDQDFDEILSQIKTTGQRMRHSRIQAHLPLRDAAWERYLEFRDSSEGKQWKQQFLVQCGYQCLECGQSLISSVSQIDHKHPRSRYHYLAWDPDNLWVICKSCNTDKGNMEWDDYVRGVKERRGYVAWQRVLKYSPKPIQ